MQSTKIATVNTDRRLWGAAGVPITRVRQPAEGAPDRRVGDASERAANQPLVARLRV